jgi:hypothetical protein
MEAGRLEVGHDGVDHRSRQIGIKQRRERDDRLLRLELAGDEVAGQEPGWPPTGAAGGP